MGVCLHHRAAELKWIYCLVDEPRFSINMYAEDVRTSTSYGLGGLQHVQWPEQCTWPYFAALLVAGSSFICLLSWFQQHRKTFSSQHENERHASSVGPIYFSPYLLIFLATFFIFYILFCHLHVLRWHGLDYNLLPTTITPVRNPSLIQSIFDSRR